MENQDLVYLDSSKKEFLKNIGNVFSLLGKVERFVRQIKRRKERKEGNRRNPNFKFF